MSDLVERLRAGELCAPDKCRDMTDPRACMCAEAAAEIARLREALEAERQLAIPFIALHATALAHDWGLPSGTLHARFYDLLAERGARMDDFKRYDSPAVEAAHDLL